jgi:hypothetical protein
MHGDTLQCDYTRFLDKVETRLFSSHPDSHIMDTAIALESQPMVDDLSTFGFNDERQNRHIWWATGTNLDGRYTFPDADPLATINWTTAKWKEQLSLTLFSPETEIEMEEWLERNCMSVTAAAPCLRTFLAVIHITVDETYRPVFSGLAAKFPNDGTTTLEQVFDEFSRQHFRDNNAPSVLEARFFNRRRAASST